MADRSRFLETVRQARVTAELPHVPEAPPAVAPPTLADVSLVEHFVAQLEAVDGAAHLVHSREVTDLVREIVARHGSADVMAWDDGELPVPISGALSGLGVHLVDPSMPHTGHAAENQRFERVQVGITGARAGLAESGSIVVVSGPGRPRMASLVPLVHVAILPAERIHRSLTDFLVAEPGVVDEGANAVVITGPSRTADIEQNLNLGVHGPGHLHVIVVASG